MFVIDSYIEINEEDRMPYKVYGIYDSKELAIKALNKLNNYFQNNYNDNILYVWNFGDGFTIQFTYVELDDMDFEHVAGLCYEVREISAPNSILITTPNSIGAVIQKTIAGIHNIMFSDND